MCIRDSGWSDTAKQARSCTTHLLTLTSCSSSMLELTMPENHSHGEESCSTCATDIFEEKKPLWKQKEVVIISIAGAIFLTGVFLDAGLSQHVLAQIAFLAATLIAGYSIIKKGLLGVIRKHRLDICLLYTSDAADEYRGVN